MTGRAVLAFLAVLALSPACGGPPAEDAPRSRLLVFAAASTADAIEQVARRFEGDRPDVDVRLSLAGSQQLASQILQGAPADVLVSANPAQMQRVVDAGLVASRPRPVAANTMTIAVAPGNPRGIAGLRDLADDALTLVLAAEEVPAGAYARRVLRRAGVSVRPDSTEPDVRRALTKVALGEADAAVVYTSDVVAAGASVGEVAIPDAANVRARYPAAVLRGAGDPSAARAFVGLLSAPAGRRILARHGFARP